MSSPDPVAGRIGPEKLPRSPAHLSASARRLWKDAVSGFVFAPPELALLESSLRAWDRAEAAREVVEREGLTFTNPRSGVAHVHPAVRIESEARREFRIGWKTLGLISEGND